MEAFPPLAGQCLAAAVCVADASTVSVVAAAFVVLVLVEAILFVALLSLLGWWCVFFLVGHPAGKMRGPVNFCPSFTTSFQILLGALQDAASAVVGEVVASYSYQDMHLTCAL